MSKCLLEERPKFFLEQRDQGLTNFALKFIRKQSETETGRGSGRLQLRIDAACFGVEVIRDGLLDFGFEFRVVFDLGTNVALEFVLNQVAKASMTKSSVDINSCSCVWMLPVSSRSIAMIHRTRLRFQSVARSADEKRPVLSQRSSKLPANWRPPPDRRATPV